MRLGYNPEGELIEVRYEMGEVHTLERHRNGQVRQEVTFDGRTIRYNYDAAGDLIWRSHGERDRVRLTYSRDGARVGGVVSRMQQPEKGAQEAAEACAGGSRGCAGVDQW